MRLAVPSLFVVGSLFVMVSFAQDGGSPQIPALTKPSEASAISTIGQFVQDYTASLIFMKAAAAVRERLHLPDEGRRLRLHESARRCRHAGGEAHAARQRAHRHRGCQAAVGHDLLRFAASDVERPFVVWRAWKPRRALATRSSCSATARARASFSRSPGACWASARIASKSAPSSSPATAEARSCMRKPARCWASPAILSNGVSVSLPTGQRARCAASATDSIPPRSGSRWRGMSFIRSASRWRKWSS